MDMSVKMSGSGRNGQKPIVSEARRHERVRLLKRLFDLFKDHDAEKEVRRLKEQDKGF